MPSKVIVQSESLDDIIVLAQTWKRLPSELAQRYMPELRRMRVTPADWYAFDLAATARWVDLRRDADTREKQRGKGDPRVSPSPARPQGHGHAAAQENGDRLAIQGTEIPPWDSRYRGKRGKRG